MDTNSTEETPVYTIIRNTTEETLSHHNSFIGITPRFGVPLVVFLVLIAMVIVYFRYKVEKKAYVYMVPLYKQRWRAGDQELEDRDGDSVFDRLEMRDLDSSLPSYLLVQPPPEYQVAVHMPRPEGLDGTGYRRGGDKYILVADHEL